MYLQLLPKVQFPLRKNEQADEDCGPVGTVEAGSCEKGHSAPLRQLPERKNLRIIKEIDDRDEKVKFKFRTFGRNVYCLNRFSPARYMTSICYFLAMLLFHSYLNPGYLG